MTGYGSLKKIIIYGVLFNLLTGCGIIEVVPFSISPIPTPLPESATSPIPVSQASANFMANEAILPTTAELPKRIMAPAIKLDAPVVEMGWTVKQSWGTTVTEWDIPYSEAGWHRNSARPGEGSNVVISGHNNSTGGRVFAALEKLAIGDQITLQTEDQELFVYHIRERNIVRALMASAETQQYLQQVMQPTTNEQLTLITCWPSWSNTHRLILIATP